MRTVSIIPGMENGAPERTDTSSGSEGVAELLAAAGLEVRLGSNDLIECAPGPHVAGTGVLDASLAGNGKATGNRQADAVISARFAPLPPKHEVHGLVALSDTGALGVGSKTVNPLAIAHDTSPSMH